MRKKLGSEAGLTMVELLAAVVILVLLTLVLSTGMNMAVQTYRAMIAKSEAELLVSTTVDALIDDLRYAWNVKDSSTLDAESADFIYDSSSYGYGARLEWGTGQITSNGCRILPTGAYGNDDVYERYRVKELMIKPNYSPGSDEVSFTIHLTLVTSDGRVSAGTPPDGVTVRCLNPR